MANRGTEQGAAFGYAERGRRGPSRLTQRFRGARVELGTIEVTDLDDVPLQPGRLVQQIQHASPAALRQYRNRRRRCPHRVVSRRSLRHRLGWWSLYNTGCAARGLRVEPYGIDCAPQLVELATFGAALMSRPDRAEAAPVVGRSPTGR